MQVLEKYFIVIFTKISCHISALACNNLGTAQHARCSQGSPCMMTIVPVIVCLMMSMPIEPTQSISINSEALFSEHMRANVPQFVSLTQDVEVLAIN